MSMENIEEVGSFWTSQQRQGHPLHEISYRACFKPQLPSFFIDRYSERGDRILDPFMGRGTTALQAYLMGRKVAASDTNPLCEQLLRPRLSPPPIDLLTLTGIRERLSGMLALRSEPASRFFGASKTIGNSDACLKVFFHPRVLAQLISMKEWFARRKQEGCYDRLDDWIRMVSLNRLSGHSPGFFSVRTMPPNQAVSLASQRKINSRLGQTPPLRNLAELIYKKSKSLLRGGIAERQSASDSIRLATCRSHELSYLSDGSVDLVITSPPFLNMVDYAQDNWLRLWFLGVREDSVEFSVSSSLEAWRDFVRKTFIELARVVRRGGRVAFEVGEVRKGKVLLEQEVIKSLAGLPFKLEKIFINRQDFTKTSNCWGVANNKSGTNSNRIAVLKKI